jgi:hypothetical protein
MALFQNSVRKKYLASQDPAAVQEAYVSYTTFFHNPHIRKNIRDAKEEQFQEGFLRELFVKILGYTINPEPDYNLTTELKNIKDAKKTDGAILKDGNALAVIELKGTDTKDLEKIRDQAFNYKNNQTDCRLCDHEQLRKASLLHRQCRGLCGVFHPWACKPRSSGCFG